MISSESNAQIKEIIKLQKQAKYRRKTGCFVVEGRKMVSESASYGKLKKVYCLESYYSERNEDITEHLVSYPVEIVSDAVFRQITQTVTPQGILGIVSMPVYSKEEILESSRRQYVLLDNLRDPGNLGTIIRTSEGAGMTAVVMSRESVDLFNPKVVRSTMGAIFRVPYLYVDSLTEFIRQLKELSVPVYATAMEGSVCYDKASYQKGAAIVIGNEANGVSKEVFDEATHRIYIPMEGRLESLNAAVATALIVYEMARQNREISCHLE